MQNKSKPKAPRTRRLITSALVVSALAVLTFWQFDARSPEPPALKDLLAVSVAGPPMHLYSADVDINGTPLDPADKSYDVPTDDGVGTKIRHVRNKDHSTTDIFFQPDGQRKAYADAFYTIVPGESIRHHKGHVIYATDGETTGSEEWFRLSGSREKVGHLLDDGSYNLFTFFEDGSTEERETLIAPGPDWVGRVQIMVREQRWHNDKGHTLAYRDVLNQDMTRDQTEWDAELNPIREVHFGPFGVWGCCRSFKPARGDRNPYGLLRHGQVVKRQTRSSQTTVPTGREGSTPSLATDFLCRLGTGEPKWL